jgi:hypothetical protein
MAVANSPKCVSAIILQILIDKFILHRSTEERSTRMRKEALVHLQCRRYHLVHQERRKVCGLSISRSSRILKSVFSARRAETRKCPVCEEVIPLRLLGTHAELESERLEEIIKQVGLTDVLLEDPDDWCVSTLSPSGTTNI